ncbi:MAG: cytochrome c [Saprospiraceae bacterium]|nr:cytochrome c [Saprospiraceae bacterium]
MKRFQLRILGLASSLFSIGLFFLTCKQQTGPEDLQAKVGAQYRKYCSNCHGGDGSISINGAVKLKYSMLSADERYLVITHGRNTMTGFESILDSTERMLLANYTLKFNNPPGHAQ